MNPLLFGVRLDMLFHLHRRRMRAHPVAELLAGAGVAIGVALVFSVLLANASLTSSASQLIHGLSGSARFQLVSRSPEGFPQRVVAEVGELPGVEVAAPVLRANVTLTGPRGRQAVQLIGLTPSLEALGGVSTQELSSASLLLKGGLGLPSSVAHTVGASAGSPLSLSSAGRLHPARVRLVLSSSIPAVASSPVAVSLLGEAQSLASLPARVTEILVRPLPHAEANVRRELAGVAFSHHLDLRPAEDELRLLALATTPNRQSTSLFTAIAVMIGFLLALNAMLLTVPERRRFIAELRLQGYDSRQVLLLLSLQALTLGVAASLVGLVAGGVLSHLFFHQVPGFLTAAFPIGAREVIHPGTVLIALACGVLATAIASLVPLLDLRSVRSPGGALPHGGSHSEVVARSTILTLAAVGVALVALSTALALLSPSLTIPSGVGLAVALVCLVPVAFSTLTGALPRALERIHSPPLIVALAELRAVTTRSVALASIVALAVYGGIAIGGARSDLLRGIDRATAQYFSTADLWVTSGRDVFNTNTFNPRAPLRALARGRGPGGVAVDVGPRARTPGRWTPGVASVRVYRGGLVDVGERRVWVRARPPSDATMLESSQLLHGDYATATRLIRGGGFAAASADFAREHHLGVGDFFTLPTPSGGLRLGVAAIATNSGWPAGALTMSGFDYARAFGPSVAALEVGLRPDVTPDEGRRLVVAALGPTSGLDVRTASERAAESASSARQGLRTLREISTLLLLAAALSVASALSAAIWQRRLRLASLKLQGYDHSQLWRAVLIESSVTILLGALVGGLLGIAGHALASRFLALTTGFPAPFAVGPLQVLLTVALFALVALAVIALPGAAAARISPRAVLQE